jgi:outer membrane receptor protein involved in Fe transport
MEDFMSKLTLLTCASALALGVCATSGAFAQNAATAADANDTLNTIVVTASNRDKTQINSSVSVTSINSSIINDFHPSAEAEVFRLIPGIQVAGTAGPGGNSNIAVRGLPVATGGAPFVQIQEDGLPTVLFGDIQFGNNDYWTHFDATVASVEGVRGGTAATHASQAPGAVINYISKTGKKDGGYVELQEGLNYQENKVNFDLANHLNDTTYFNVGGYFKIGRGPLHASYNVSNSFQIKGNITKEFNDGKGYFRLLAKIADTQEPNYTGSPALATVNGTSVSNISAYPGFDGRSQSNYSLYNSHFNIVNRDGAVENVEMNGITTHARSLQAQFHYDFSSDVTLDNNARWTSMSGGFASPFLNVGNTVNTNAIPTGFVGGTNACNIVAAQQAAGVADKNLYSSNGIIGSCINGAVVGAVKYANGPNAGQAFTGTYLDNNVNVDTKIRDVGSLVNDMHLSAKKDMGGGAKVTGNAGWFIMNQRIAMDWHVNKSLREVNGNNPSQLDIYDTAGNQLSVAGQYGFNNNWGACCARDYDYSYTDSAPYASLDYDSKLFNLDGSVRFETVTASGSGRASTGTATNTVVPTGTGKTVAIPTFSADGPLEIANYSRSYTTWTVGGLFHASKDASIFVRASRGGRFNSDRQTFGGKFSSSGALCTSAAAAAGTGGCAADGVTPSVDFVNQYELGLKDRGALLGGRYTVEFTLLKGNFKQSTYELSATKCPGSTGGGCVKDAQYKSTGAELYATYFNKGLTFFVNATYSDAQQLDAGATTYRKAENIPNLSYTLGAKYALGTQVSVGLDATGVSSEVNGGNTYPGGTTFNGNIKFSPLKNLEMGADVYNLFNSFDFRGAGGITNAAVTPAVIGGAPVIGRTFTGSVKFKF